MIHMGYNRVGKRRRGGAGRGFRLKIPRKVSVQRLQARFVRLFRLLSRWRCSCGQAMQSLRRCMSRRNASIIRRGGSSKKRLIMEMPGGDYRFRSFGRSNSFYSEAIADCLEFIKRSSISVEQKHVLSSE